MNEFQKQMLALLDQAQIIRGEGEAVMIYHKQFSNLPSSLIIYMDSEAKDLALAHKFLYLPSFSGEDRLLFVDVTYKVKEYSNGVDINGFRKTEEGATEEITLKTIRNRSQSNVQGNYGSLFNDLVNDLIPLFPGLHISIPLQSLGKAAHIEIGKCDEFYNAGIYVVSDLNDDSIAKYQMSAIRYAQIDKSCLGAVSDGYTFVVWSEDLNTGLLLNEKMDYAHFVGKLAKILRLVF